MKQETYDKIKSALGENTDDTAIAILEAMDDEGIGEDDWKQKYNDLDAQWRKRYTERFSEGSSTGNHGNPDTNNSGLDVHTEKSQEEIENERLKSLNLNDLLFTKEGTNNA